MRLHASRKAIAKSARENPIERCNGVQNAPERAGNAAERPGRSRNARILGAPLTGKKNDETPA